MDKPYHFKGTKLFISKEQNFSFQKIFAHFFKNIINLLDFLFFCGNIFAVKVPWLSWLERFVHIEEVIGSSPIGTTISAPFEAFFYAQIS